MSDGGSGTGSVEAFDALPHRLWPTIAAVLPRPWPRAAAEHDLRWHAAEHGTRRRKLPNVRDLADRWGWAKSTVYDLLRGNAWKDAARPWGWGADTDARVSSGQDSDKVRTPRTDKRQLSTNARTRSGQGSDSRAIHTDHPVTQSPKTPRTPPRGGGATVPAQARQPLPDFGAVFFTSTQTAERLIRAGVDTTEKLIALTAEQVRYLPGIGPRVRNVEACLRQHGLALATTPTKTDPLAAFAARS